MDDKIMRAVARELDVHVLAWNAGAELLTPGVRYMKIEDCTFNGPITIDSLPRPLTSVDLGLQQGEVLCGWGPEQTYRLALPLGWAAWYAVGDELR